MEIERKFLVNNIPFSLNNLKFSKIGQGYISINPVIRVRQLDDSYYLTVKSKGLMCREELELEITFDEFNALKTKINYNLIFKYRYYIPLDGNLICELDIFKDSLSGLIIAEVEFPNEEVCNNFSPLDWFGKEVTFDVRYQNSNLCKIESLKDLDID